jgi:protease IV
MKQFFKMFFASFLAMVVMGVVIFAIVIGIVAGIAGSSTSEKTTEVADNSVLLLETNKLIHEQGESNSFAPFSGDFAYSPGLYDVCKAIEHAKKDDNIKGILLKLSFTPNGWATMQQLRHSLADFRKSNKFIYAYGEMIPQKTYYLASVADSIFLNPVGYTELKGLSSTMPFFKGTLEKLEVTPEIFYAGKFKSATEPFRADKMSEPNRQQVAALQSDFWNEFLSAVAAHTKTSAAAVHQLALGGLVQFPVDALNNKLVDELLYWDQVESRIRTKTSQKADEKIKYVDLEDYASNVRANRKVQDDRIAVLFAEGSISDGEKNADYEIASTTFIEEIRKIKKNDKVKAVVLRINSPGGSALASEVILRELQLLRQKKPLIVSMGDVAASGGYYIACQADSIFALPNTITGSIGVFTMLFNAESLLKNKLGITFDEVKNAPFADFPSVTRPFSADENRKMQAGVDTIYSIFKRRVATGRRMQEFMVDSFAQGRVWSGTDALRIGLVDGLGGLDRAIYSAAKKANLKDYQVVTFPAPVDKFESMMRRFKGGGVSATVIKAAMEEELGDNYEYIEQLKALNKMNGRAQMAMPFSLKIN